MTPEQKAEYIQQTAELFNNSIKRRLCHPKQSSRAEHEIILRSMIDEKIVNVDKVVRIIYPSV